mgnify:CR=1 FL=1
MQTIRRQETAGQSGNDNELQEESAMNFNEAALKLHEEHHGKIEVTSKVPVKTRDDLSTAYTPGVAEPAERSMIIRKMFTSTLQRAIGSSCF